MAISVLMLISHVLLTACKFSKGDWSECDESTNLKTRTDRLVKGDTSKCEATRVISRKCGSEEG